MNVKSCISSGISHQEGMRLEAMMCHETSLKRLGFQSIAGVDEAGRGPLAGPVVAVACILPEGARVEGIDDSKKLSVSERQRIFQSIRSLGDIDYGIGIIDSLTIDKVNILQATLQAMLLAVSHLLQPPDYLLVDGNQMPKTQIPGKFLIKGDRLSQSIAAASIIAKEVRDQLMCEFHQLWPEYGFNVHKGYGTKLHLRAIEKYGPCPIHRLSFKPLKDFYD